MDLPTSRASMDDHLRALASPLSRLEPERALEAIRLARHLGYGFGERFARCVACLVGRDLPVRPNPRAYYTYLVEPSWKEGGLDAEAFRQWEEAFASGAALRDPRVQAFCTGLAEYALEVAGAVSRKRRLLATFLEIRPDRVAVHAGGPREQAVFGFREERFVVLGPSEATAGPPLPDEAGPGCLDPRIPGSGRRAVEESVFLDHRILRWRAAPDPAG